MKLYDARSYFSGEFEDRVADPAELERQLYEHRMEAPYILEAILELAAFGQAKRRACKMSAAARTLSGESALEWLTAVGGRASWGEFSLTIRRKHRRAGVRVSRVLEQLERDGVLVVTYPDYRGQGREGVIVELAPELRAPAIRATPSGLPVTQERRAAWSGGSEDEPRERPFARKLEELELACKAEDVDESAGLEAAARGETALLRAVFGPAAKPAQDDYSGFVR